MPELPEVENVKRFLLNNLKDKTILKVIKVDQNNIILEKDIEELNNIKILDIERIAKFLIFKLENEKVLISHLRMEGRYYILDKPNNYSLDEVLKNYKYVHVVFEFSDKLLLYIDKRKFGKFILKNNDTYLKEKPLINVASEPFLIDIDTLYSKIKRSNKCIKSVLLDQSIISGLGNIYVDEVLFMSKIRPDKKANLLDKQDVINIKANAIEILNHAILEKGTTIYSFEVSQGMEGNYQNFLKVHTKENMPCSQCSSLIKKIKVDQRGTYYCEKCQK